jgi:hypothetical protein
MALTANTNFDLEPKTQSIVFSNPSSIDSVSFKKDLVTFSSNPGFVVSKNDLILYIRNLTNFKNLIQSNFSPASSYSLCQYDLDCDAGRVIYSQVCKGKVVYCINYSVSTQTATVIERPEIKTSFQELCTSCLFLNEFSDLIGKL